MNITRLITTFTLAALLTISCVHSQQVTDAKQSEANLKAGEENRRKAIEWVESLKLDDAGKQSRLVTVITTHLNLIRNWNNEHPFTTVPAGINPATGNKLSDLDRQVIAISAMPKSIHDDLMNGLRKDLTEEQVEAILDKYTIGKVQFTLNGYKSIVPDLKPEEEAQIVKYLKQAREQAVDYKNMKQISAIFEIYKTKCEQYLNNNGRNWRQLYKSYTDMIKAKKNQNQD